VACSTTSFDSFVSPPSSPRRSPSYLLRAARNQVAHSVDDSMVLFKDQKAATFTVDVLLALCRVDLWTS
jgi:hypothetical protein